MADEENDGKAKDAPTKRVVIRQARALVLPAMDAETEKTIAKLVKDSAAKGATLSDVWVELGKAEGDKPEAIAKYAGVKGAADAKPGVYRAPTVSSWKDGVRYKDPRTVVDAETVT